MFKLVEFLQKRPKDRTILMGRGVFGIIIAILLGLNLNNITLHLPSALQSYENIAIYGLFILAIIPFFMGVSGLCIAKRKYIRIMQISFGVILFIVGNWFVDVKTAPTTSPITSTQSGSLDYNALSESKTPSKPVNVGFWLAFLGILPLIAGISGKCITNKCLKYGEVIKKIRV
jgi:hypothetical protein